MISAASPRFAFRPAPAFARVRDWRWAALFGLFFAILIAGVVEGQIGRGDRGITPINSSGDFLASGIAVDVTGDNADDARTKGWREAQRKGWAQLYRRINGSNGPALSDSVLDGIVTAIVVEHEQIGPRRYVAKLGVQFDRVRAGQILGVSGRTLRSPPLLVIPVYSIDGMPQVFEQRSAWQRAWAEYNTGQSAIDYVRTAGTGADTLLLNPGQIGRRGRVWWRVILDQYGAADVLIPIARVEYSYPGGPVTGHFTARFGPDNKLIDSFTMTGPSPAALPDMMEKAVARMDQIYTDALAAGTLRTDAYLVLEKPVEVKDLPVETTTTTALPTETDSSVATATPAAGVQSFTVQYSSPDVESVSATERSVGGVPGVQSAATTSLALGGTSVMRVTFRGDGAALRAALEARGYRVQGSGSTLRISR
ncbi:MAG TPA: heavy-metal-associated domain-containing protein [Sphingopyxis sp.]|nr:heavy-metal-associated domain-containing protein [Sphingopyxis sp.]HMP44282.1 heavy-metal-associated domain-containing protein [Sphingopyxis sp.]HMQ19554.1 heavy-metal-associated domain-containing protein [Sphingopyxis sp.]